MNVAIIFAGGTGQRMSSSGIPKQFLLVNQKPIIVHTLEHFQYAPNIDKIIVVSLASGIPQVESLVARFGLTKVVSIIPGGSTGQESIFRGLEECRRLFDDDTVVLLHDGVRPIINETMIEECISCVLHHGNAITVYGNYFRKRGGASYGRYNSRSLTMRNCQGTAVLLLRRYS